MEPVRTIAPPCGPCKGTALNFPNAAGSGGRSGCSPRAAGRHRRLQTPAGRAAAGAAGYKARAGRAAGIEKICNGNDRKAPPTSARLSTDQSLEPRFQRRHLCVSRPRPTSAPMTLLRGPGFRDAGHRTTSCPQRRDAPRRLRDQRIVRPVMLRVSALQVLLDLVIAAVPEADEVSRDLHRTPRGRQQFQQQRQPPAATLGVASSPNISCSRTDSVGMSPSR